METTITVWWADLTAADAALEASLPAPERARLEGLTGASRARRAVGAALLRRAVNTHRGEDRDSGGRDRGSDGDVVVGRACYECGEQHGRPVVQGGPFVSVAHAGVLVVVVTCESSPVGVDVERLARFEGEASPAEVAEAWVRHEARLKAGVPGAVGEGAGHDDPDPALVPLVSPLPGYTAAVCATRADEGRLRLVLGR